MADRYWVGGTASWDGTAGTKWSDTSGGAGGASVPTSADDVFFNASSTGTVTIAAGNTGAKSINCTGFTGTITGTANISVSGSITLVSGMTYTHTGTVSIIATGTLITAGKTFSGLTVNGAGITVTLGDALNVGGRNVTVTSGTFTTANFNVTAAFLVSSGSTIRTINLGSSTLTLSSGVTFTSTNHTFNAGTSQINITAFSATFEGGGRTFNNVSITTSNLLNFGSSGLVFNNFTITGTAGVALSTCSTQSNITVNGTFTLSGNSAIDRIRIDTNDLGRSRRTITAAVFVSSDCDFDSIAIAGAAAGTSVTRGGNLGNNSGITFPAAKTVYRVGTNTTWAGSNSWATSSGGTGADTNFPLAQDTAVIDNSTTGSALTIATYNISALDLSNRTDAFTLTHSAFVFFGSSYTLGSGVTIAGTGNMQINRFSAGNVDFNTAGKTVTFPIQLYSLSGTLRLQSAITSTNSINLTGGTINLNGFNFTATTFSSTLDLISRGITFNGGTLTLTGSGSSVLNVSGSLFTTTAGTGNGTINMTSASAKTFAGGSRTYNCALNNSGAGALTITGSNVITTLSNSVQPTTFTFTAGTTTTITNWNVNGTTGNLVTIGSATAANHTLSKTSGTVSANFLSISRSTATGGASWYAGSGSTDGGNNSGWIFADAPVAVLNGNFMLLFD